jgi:hypothetical protein
MMRILITDPRVSTNKFSVFSRSIFTDTGAKIIFNEADEAFLTACYASNRRSRCSNSL